MKLVTFQRNGDQGSSHRWSVSKPPVRVRSPATMGAKTVESLVEEPMVYTSDQAMALRQKTDMFIIPVRP